MAKRRGLGNIPQISASLDEPLDKDAPPTIYATELTPQLATASLNLSIEFLKQQQGLANKYLVFHPFTLFSVLACVFVYLLINTTFPSTIVAHSATGYFYQLMLINSRTFVTAFIVFAISATSIFTFVSRFSETFFKSKISEITKSNGESVYGVNLALFKTGNVKPTSKESKNFQKNTHVIMYRATPISIISISENKIISNPHSLVMNISTMGSRKVYIPSGILEDLVDWALIRTKEIAQKEKYGSSMKVLINVYSFDTVLKSCLRKKGFSLIQSGKLQENRILGGLFGVQSELWGVQFHYEPAKSEK
ncbi:hypothetical protein TBLA_0B06690 [Henningerozyma blattae CBS 6284]|uniref:Inorganic phosphate transporter PHO86 n=1 Tax=Henningerozyma blattae (strain ATCC 34711 / CBS 6284 / DSM 70876 / NBRC 10599 / NRRL Y-10934 / UCD 77-7) TaxID=1071380 RepID=I2GZD9_HENB6|nr:hypothetical protein TBLA_0B06690 [Tetrapisispora blattae CBS 6284]CCH59491.1 hypothetical protein TBLA_0B06690 [Tetrapisispora blattae CBS 6284]